MDMNSSKPTEANEGNKDASCFRSFSCLAFKTYGHNQFRSPPNSIPWPKLNGQWLTGFPPLMGFSDTSDWMDRQARVLTFLGACQSETRLDSATVRG